MAELVAKFINYIGSFGPYAQLAVGSASGWIIGLSVIKISKFAVAIIGGSILLIQIAEIENWIQIDWVQMQQNAHNFSTKAFNNITVPRAPDFPTKVHNFLVSFIGGSLIGIGCA